MHWQHSFPVLMALNLLQYVSTFLVQDVDSQGPTSLGPLVTFLLTQPPYAGILFFTLHTFHHSPTYLTDFPLIHVVWCNLAPFGLKNRWEALLHRSRNKSMLICYFCSASLDERFMKQKGLYLSLDGVWKWHVLWPEAEKRCKKHFGHWTRDFSNTQM